MRSNPYRNNDDHHHGEEYGCTVRKLMLSHKNGTDPHRHNFFLANCIIQGNVFELIIDSGSKKNIISRDAVSKLQLVS